MASMRRAKGERPLRSAADLASCSAASTRFEANLSLVSQAVRCAPRRVSDFQKPAPTLRRSGSFVERHVAQTSVLSQQKRMLESVFGFVCDARPTTKTRRKTRRVRSA